MKTFDNYYTEENFEELFLELIHLDELEITFDFFSYNFELYYLYNGKKIIIQNKHSTTFWIEFDIWDKIKNNLDFDYKEIRNHLVDMVYKHFGLIDYSIRHL